jgi:acetyltransferase-like isoleucine patch superfamily enzyme
LPLEIVDGGLRNRVSISPEVLMAGTGKVVFTGDDNEVSIEPGCSLLSVSMEFHSGCRFRAGPNCRLAALEVFGADRAHVSIGQGTNFTWHTRLLLHEPGTIRIGDGCMVASGTLFTVSDMHAIVDLETGERTNPARDIVVENDVWVGGNVTVLKGVTIGRGSVIGLGAVVTRAVPPTCVAAGVPARVVRTNVSWRV